MPTTVELIGPLTTSVVVVNGRQVPHLTADPQSGGIVTLTLDNRFSLDVPVADLDRYVEFIADAIAVGMGFASHPRTGQDPVPRPPFTRWSALETAAP